MNIKKDVKEFFKIATKNANKKNTASLKLKLALGELEANEENVNKVFEENEELKEEFASVQELQRELMFDIAFFIMEKTGEGEQDIFKLLADMYSVPLQEISELGFNEMLEAIMEIIRNEEIQKGFLSIFK